MPNPALRWLRISTAESTIRKDKKLAAKKSSPAFDFVVAQLKKNKKAKYGDVAEAARKKGHKIFPIMYGRAKALLGLVESAPRGSGKAARRKVAKKKAAARKTTARRGPGRPRKTAATSLPAGSIEAVIKQVKAGEAEREGYRRALERIRAILDDVL